MVHQSEFQELSEYVDKLDDKYTNEAIRQDYTTWAMQELIKVIRQLTDDKSIHDQLDKVLADIMSNC